MMGYQGASQTWIEYGVSNIGITAMMYRTRHKYAVAHPEVEESKGYVFQIGLSFFAIVFGDGPTAVVIPAYDQQHIGTVDVAEAASAIMPRVYNKFH